MSEPPEFDPFAIFLETDGDRLLERIQEDVVAQTRKTELEVRARQAPTSEEKERLKSEWQQLNEEESILKAKGVIITHSEIQKTLRAGIEKARTQFTQTQQEEVESFLPWARRVLREAGLSDDPNDFWLDGAEN
jgi:hypothetical protein